MRTGTQMYSTKRTAMPGANLEGGDRKEKEERKRPRRQSVHQKATRAAWDGRGRCEEPNDMVEEVFWLSYEGACAVEAQRPFPL